MRLMPLLALLAACASTPPRAADGPQTHAMYEGDRPPLDKAAVLLVFSPPEEPGKTMVGRIISEASREDYRPPLDVRQLHLEAGHYRLEAYFWIARSRMENGKLVIENLQSGSIAPMDLFAEEGRTYFIRAEMRRKDEIRADERGGFFALNYGATVADPESLRSGDSSSLAESEFVWKPHLVVVPPAQAKQYRSYR